MPNSTNYTQTAVVHTNYSLDPLSKNNKIMDDTVVLMDDATYTLDDASIVSWVPNSTNYTNA